MAKATRITTGMKRLLAQHLEQADLPNEPNYDEHVLFKGYVLNAKDAANTRVQGLVEILDRRARRAA